MNYYSDIPIEKREKRRILVTFLIASLMLICIGITLYVKYRSILESRESVKDTYITLLATKDVFSALQDLETGQRGYLLTGDREFLEPYERAGERIDIEMNELSQRVAGNARRMQQMEELRHVIDNQRKLLQAQVDARDKTKRNTIITIKEAATAKALMDHVRSLTDRMLDDEKQLLVERYDSERQRRDSFTRMLLFSVLLTLLGLMVSNAVIIQAGLRRRKVELDLQSSQQFSDSIVDSSTDCIKLLGIDGEILSINEGGCKLLELDNKADMLGRNWPENWQGEYRGMAQKAMADASAGRMSHFEGEAATYKGTMRWWEVIITPVFNSNRQVHQLLAISRDITERYLAERIIRENEARFRQMADTLPHMVWVTQPDGFHEYYNKRWYEFTGVPDGSTDGEEWSGMFHPEDQERAWERWRHSLKSGEPYEIECRLRRADGVYCWTLGRALPVRDSSGKITKWYGTCTVIEEQKRVEAELREARDAAERANAAKSEFLANMSHEIRTPMNAVVGLSNLLTSSSMTPEKRNEFIKTIQLSAQQLMELINDLLDIAKLDSQNVELEKIPFNLAELLEEIISVMGVKAKERKVELVVKYSPDMNRNFLGDPLRLRQILMNLVSNALKFTEKGTVTLQADHCNNDETGEWDVCFDVIDTGIGIPPNKLDTIFSKFSQADTTITRKYGGTGLGLSICKTLVELMNGTIKVVSTEGLGSKFSVAIPFMPSDGAPATLKNRRPTSGASKTAKKSPSDQQRVLLVEDYKANVLVATQTIEDCGFSWELAEDGLEAIAKIKSGKYDVVLMDVQMPNMDGITATRHIREWEKQLEKTPTPILGITAYSTDGDRDKCLEAGMNDYLSKPFNPEVLKDKIRALTKSKPKN